MTRAPESLMAGTRGKNGGDKLRGMDVAEFTVGSRSPHEGSS